MMLKFNEEKNVAVLTTRKVIQKEKEIHIVIHDDEDGMWQFLDGEDTQEKDICLVSIQEITELDPSLVEVAELPLGWIAWRKNSKEQWNVQVLPNE